MLWPIVVKKVSLLWLTFKKNHELSSANGQGCGILFEETETIYKLNRIGTETSADPFGNTVANFFVRMTLLRLPQKRKRSYQG